MNITYLLEINFILFLQNIGNWLTPIFQAFTFMGYSTFYIIILPLIYWCIDSSIGLRLSILFLFSGITNNILKHIFRMPRPYWVESKIQALDSDPEFGFPSGHAQNASSAWGLLASQLWQKARKFSWLVIVVISLIGFSRIYLGVHFPYQVIAGSIIGILILLVFIKFEKKILSWFNRFSFGYQIGFLFVSSLVLLALMLLSIYVPSPAPIPITWTENSIIAKAAKLPNPFIPKDSIQYSGLWFGLTAGATWLWKRSGPFTSHGKISQKILRYVLGMAITIFLVFGLSKILPELDTLIGLFLFYWQSVLVGFWVWGLAPWVFRKMHLAE